ncbi:MAG: hypothetical protein ACYSU1_03425 [Planctomycetota bacterium]|jgi:hypothetical protein
MDPSPPPASRSEPLPADWTVAEGLDAYLEENGFQKETYDAPRTPANFLGIRFSVPNPPKHRWAIMLHDLHHVATGFGTNPAGEGQISAWECRVGLRGLGFYVGSIVFGGLLLGMVAAPVKTTRAWKAAGSCKSLFHLPDYRYEELLDLKIHELRDLLGVDREGLYQGERGLHAGAPKESASSAGG